MQRRKKGTVNDGAVKKKRKPTAACSAGHPAVRSIILVAGREERQVGVGRRGAAHQSQASGKASPCYIDESYYTIRVYSEEGESHEQLIRPLLALTWTGILLDILHTLQLNSSLSLSGTAGIPAQRPAQKLHGGTMDGGNPRSQI